LKSSKTHRGPRRCHASSKSDVTSSKRSTVVWRGRFFNISGQGGKRQPAVSKKGSRGKESRDLLIKEGRSPGVQKGSSFRRNTSQLAHRICLALYGKVGSTCEKTTWVAALRGKSKIYHQPWLQKRINQRCERCAVGEGDGGRCGVGWPAGENWAWEVNCREPFLGKRAGRASRFSPERKQYRRRKWRIQLKKKKAWCKGDSKGKQFIT